MKLNEKIFREYDIRGNADADLPEDVVDSLSRGIASFMKSKGGKSMALGYDCRVSSPRISEVFRSGLLSSGIDVVDVGLVPTPLLYFAVAELGVDGGVMITGSHNPPEQNGFKVCIGPSTIHGDDVQAIKRRILTRDYVQGTGTLRRQDVKDMYIDKVASGIRQPLRLKVVLDNGNGMAGLVAAKLFRRLGCEVTDLFPELDGRFPNHHPDPTMPENLTALIAEVKRQNAVVGVGFDGDADRIGVVDRTGRMIFGDELLVLYARQILSKNPGATIISEVKASHRLFQDIERHGGNAILWKTGHSLIKAKMREEKALLAGEMSGHIFFKDRYYGFDDAIYAAARLFEILDESGKTPGELLADLPTSHSTPEIRVDCPDELKFDVVEKAREMFRKQGHKVNGIDGARLEFSDGWGLVRASNTQPVLVYRFEAESERRLREIRELVENTVRELIRNA